MYGDHQRYTFVSDKDNNLYEIDWSLLYGLSKNNKIKLNINIQYKEDINKNAKYIGKTSELCDKLIKIEYNQENEEETIKSIESILKENSLILGINHNVAINSYNNTTPDGLCLYRSIYQLFKLQENNNNINDNIIQKNKLLHQYNVELKNEKDRKDFINFLEYASNSPNIEFNKKINSLIIEIQKKKRKKKFPIEYWMDFIDINILLNDRKLIYNIFVEKGKDDYIYLRLSNLYNQEYEFKDLIDITTSCYYVSFITNHYSVLTFEENNDTTNLNEALNSLSLKILNLLKEKQIKSKI